MLPPLWLAGVSQESQRARSGGWEWTLGSPERGQRLVLLTKALLLRGSVLMGLEQIPRPSHAFIPTCGPQGPVNSQAPRCPGLVPAVLSDPEPDLQSAPFEDQLVGVQKQLSALCTCVHLHTLTCAYIYTCTHKLTCTHPWVCTCTH